MGEGRRSVRPRDHQSDRDSHQEAIAQHQHLGAAIDTSGDARRKF
jgi:hypothetical protein